MSPRGGVRLCARLCACAAACAPWLFAGCSTGTKLRARATQIAERNDSMQVRAYNCAPRAYALAVSHNDFGGYELDQGDFARAKRHLEIAETQARLADELSDFPQCRDSEVSLRAEATPLQLPPKPGDTDGDGYLDPQDGCPQDPEDFDGFEDEDGCPEPDNDQDAVADALDRCPNVAEDADGFEDEDGCPDLDNDQDGLADRNDNCPDEPEDFDGFEERDGCPDPDNDQDAIADALDRCPMEPEDYDDDRDDDGCPEGAARAQIQGDRIQLNEKIFFRFNRATIMPVSYPLLDDVAQILAENRSLEIRVEGHTDSKGSDRYNEKLSQKRAAAVRTYLLGRGIEPERMRSIGFGEERPIESNATEDGRAANRRVEIHITKR